MGTCKGICSVSAYEPGYSDLHQLAHVLVTESKAKEWVDEAEWKNPMEHFQI